LADENVMPYPNINWGQERGFDARALQGYLAHLYVRKSLNRVYGLLYNRGSLLPSGVPNIIVAPPGFGLHSGDPPAKDILSARLRAKFWDAQVILYRPFIRQILEGDLSFDSEMIRHAKKGTEALIESSRAFHGLLGERFIDINLFGTAHM
jgi:hypothetical protein